MTNDGDREKQEQADTSPRSGVPELQQPKTEFRGILKPLAYLDTGLAWFEAFILSAGVLLLAANSIANIIGRFGFGASIQATEEINTFLVILITFAGIGYAARQGRHIRMSAIYDQLNDRWRKIFMVVIALLTAAVMFVLAWYSVSYVLSVYNTGRIAPATRLPVYITLVWLPVGFVVTGIQYILTAVANVSRPDVYLSSSVVDTYEDTETPI